MALAVTILVLLILAGISITAALGDKGIINETKNVQKDIAYLQNQTLDDLHQLTNELSTSVWDALEPGDPDTPTTPEVKVTKITITAPSSPVTVKQGGTLQLSVAVEPSNASNKGVIWSSNVASIATVDQTGRVTGVSIGTATIIATAKDGSGVTGTISVTVETAGTTVGDSSSSSHTGTEINYTWEQIDKIAKAIAESPNVGSLTMEVTGSVDGTPYTIGVGDKAEVTYGGVDRTVRVLGFNHDDLTNPTAAYGSGTTATKAGISFEFLDCLMDSTPMHTSNSNTNGWVIKSLYKTLNNTTNGTYIGLQNSGIPIKQVQKTYNAPATEGADTPQTSSDYLWLLSCTEIWGVSAYTGCESGFSKAKEGEQYPFYEKCSQKPVYNAVNTNLIHYNRAGTSGVYCWLRSVEYDSTWRFCHVDNSGTCYYYMASNSNGVAPGFCI